jgi:hypothetical protein
MKLADSITLMPYVHGRLAYARHVRDLCLANKFDCICVDLPASLEDHCAEAVGDLPYISAVVAWAADDPVFYVPIDPCDAAIEAIRQSMQLHVPCFCIGHPKLRPPARLPPLPHEYAMEQLGFDAYSALCLRVVNGGAEAAEALKAVIGTDAVCSANDWQYTAHKLLAARAGHKNILALVHLCGIPDTVRFFMQEKTCNLSFGPMPSYNVTVELINPDHLYFALGELPFIVGKSERERCDPFAPALSITESIKSLFTETRDDCSLEKTDIDSLPPARIQRALTFVRNLTVQDSRFVPTLFDIVSAAKGIGGNSYALRILKNARYYPFLPFELGRPLMSVGIKKIAVPGENSAHEAINLLRDQDLAWRTLSIKPDPSQHARRNYRYAWDPSGACSHVPEDRSIEQFNAHVRKKARRIEGEDRSVVEKFTVSVKDGIDIRETMRSWLSGDIYVREVPPDSGATDTVVIIFDRDHDATYTHRATWYAEHGKESTLTFYATDPFDDLIGPGVARSYYGGLSLLFPPRAVPNVFDLPVPPELTTCAETLAYGGLLFSKEKIIPYVAARTPGVRLRSIAAHYKKRFLWIPLSTFSMETIRRLRKFHVLNGKTVRSWAARFIGD